MTTLHRTSHPHKPSLASGKGRGIGHRLARWASLGSLGVLTALPGGAWAATDVVLRLETALGHNTNPLRLANDDLGLEGNDPANPETSGANNSASASASATLLLRTDLGLSWDLGHPANRLQLTHQLLRREYGQVPGLNGNTQRSTATLTWASLPWLEGRLNTAWQSNPERLDTGDNTTRNGIQTSQTHGGTVTLKPTPTWAIALATTRSSGHTEAAIARESGSTQDNSQRMGLAWSPQPGRTVGWGLTRSRLRTTPVLWGTGTDSDEARQQTQALSMDWRLGPKTQFNASLGTQRWSLPLADRPKLTTHPMSAGLDHRYSSITRIQYQFRRQTTPNFSARSGLSQQLQHDWSLNWDHSPKTRWRLDLTRARLAPAFQDGGLRGSERTRQWALVSRLEHEWQRPWTAYIEMGMERKDIEYLDGSVRHLRQRFWQLGLRYDWQRSRHSRDAMAIQMLP